MPETPLRGAASEREDSPSAVPLMQIATGFWVSKTLAAAVELELFTRISRTGADTADLGRMFGLHPRPAEMLLSACAALRLLTGRGGRFFNSALAEKYLVKGKPTYFGGLVTMLDRRLYLPFHRLTEALRTNRAQTWGEQPGLFEAILADPEEQRVFTEAMHSMSTPSGRAVAAAFDFSSYTQLLDVGGGSGAYCIEAARRWPHLRAIVFDMAPALMIARDKIAEAGLADRISTHEGDFFNEALPRGSDVILLSMILHDWGPEKNRAILAKCFAALPSRGALIVSELMMDDDKTGPPAAALESLCMLIETEGRNYCWAEYEAWLTEAGFCDLARVPIDSLGANGLLVGYRL